MTAALSNDLRLRVVMAIVGGLSRRAAAAKFDVSVASAEQRRSPLVTACSKIYDRYTNLFVHCVFRQTSINLANKQA